MSEPELFIGGPCDGRRIAVEAGRTTVIMRRPTRADLTTDVGPWLELIDTPSHAYRLEKLTSNIGGEARVFRLWVSQNLTVARALERLIDGYHGAPSE